ncbi:MAG: diacylglycerol kinase family protein [Sphingobacteriaceae bacterium]|nr:diacylglycerol kinase family protein [Sphingobacteriaceae bacterium]
MKKAAFSISQRLQSFGYAFNGLKILFKEEHNARVHLAATVLVIAASLFFELNAFEWMAVIFAIGLVFMAEIFNSAIENLADFMTTETNSKIKTIKDLAAAGVLLSAITAASIGLLVFVPKLL